ncbi:Protein-S-isoprenylcysteine O-methyltransferase Ste14 [Lentzea albidocapillata subsp. violacea]|uniref:Protein-S-isoprenylcysteine O-methyltransferase Ste14 n=1 Tax=Lentzea albidocapillata subsp. violacea TaxID=128104 RepID=A0A1G9WU59_9PSEU|nr:isoprenylcysteine carboxylmethyltransferase family protein [Lentzea albidocapillata]SDM87889.1 Protein-S-isoprenylcysteine O-methyltransferase Ste14 [Lentzea albidocapillata subsp. violacea]
MAVTALVLFGTFVLLSTARVLIQRQRTGDTGTRQWTIQPGSTQWWAHWTFNLGVLITGVGAPIGGLSALRPLAVLDHPGVQVLGVVLAMLGVLATFAAQMAMGGSWRIAVDETEHTGLVTHGPFRLVRNPIFSAALVGFLGLTLMVPNPVALGGFLIMLAGVELQVRTVEEPYLRRTHAGAYTDYAARVGRFLPGIGRIHRTHGS